MSLEERETLASPLTTIYTPARGLYSHASIKFTLNYKINPREPDDAHFIISPPRKKVKARTKKKEKRCTGGKK